MTPLPHPAQTNKVPSARRSLVLNSHHQPRQHQQVPRYHRQSHHLQSVPRYRPQNHNPPGRLLVPHRRQLLSMSVHQHPQTQMTTTRTIMAMAQLFLPPPI